MKKLLLAGIACALVFAACQKKEDTDPIDVSKTTYLKSGKWQLKYLTWLPDIGDTMGVPVDQYTPLPGCKKDDFYIFTSINRATFFEGDTKCNVADPDSVALGYALTNDDKHLELYGNPDDETHNTVLAGDMTYPSIDTFVITYLKTNPIDTTKTSRYTEKYVKLP
ncbi:hypothetical protein [Taibaiella koreensis]|uniref:hypothetical protein n=1 Tax=Taibaiella koreensis TaxID=1268548 RepID=UPI000E59C762|nr:hypothetical protein [Taibaiella koreensis]